MLLYEKYLRFKNILPTAIIFLECRDFWETFGNDAILVSTLLNLPLTHRKIDENTSVPIVGIVYHEFDDKNATLNELGVTTAKVSA